MNPFATGLNLVVPGAQCRGSDGACSLARACPWAARVLPPKAAAAAAAAEGEGWQQEQEEQEEQQEQEQQQQQQQQQQLCALF